MELPTVTIGESSRDEICLNKKSWHMSNLDDLAEGYELGKCILIHASYHDSLEDLLHFLTKSELRPHFLTLLTPSAPLKPSPALPHLLVCRGVGTARPAGAGATCFWAAYGRT